MTILCARDVPRLVMRWDVENSDDVVDCAVRIRVIRLFEVQWRKG